MFGFPQKSITHGQRTETVIYDHTLKSAGSWDVDNIDQSYEHLIISAWTRSSVATTVGEIYHWINADTTVSNYRYVRVGTNGGNLVNSAGGSDSFCGHTTGSSSPANAFGFWRCVIPSYSASLFRKLLIIDDWAERTSDRFLTTRTTVAWNSTEAINRLRFRSGPSSGTFAVNSRLQIVGITTT